MALKWRRGFFRVWVVCAALWIAGGVTIALRDNSIPSLTHKCREILDFLPDGTNKPLGAADVTQCEKVWSEERITLAESIFIPPIGLFIAGWIIAWIFCGFRPENSN